MSVKTYSQNIRLSKHFNSFELQCPECRKTKISTELIQKVEELFSKLKANHCIVLSGYRSSKYDIKIKETAGKHKEGLAMDCCFFAQNGTIIPSKIVCCLAYDLKIPGIVRIDEHFVHLDIRKKGFYYKDEMQENSIQWTNPYQYFQITQEEIENYLNKVEKKSKKCKSYS